MGHGASVGRQTSKIKLGGVQPQFVFVPPAAPQRNQSRRGPKPPDASDIETIEQAAGELAGLANTSENQKIMLDAAKKEILRARTVLRESRLPVDKSRPCEMCKVAREEYVEKQVGSSKTTKSAKTEPGPLVKVMRVAPERCSQCKENRSKYNGFSSQRDQELVDQAEIMANEVIAFTQADDDDLATKEKKLEDFQKKKKAAVTARNFKLAASIHQEMEGILGRLDDAHQEMIRLRKCTKLIRMLRVLIDEIKPKLQEAVAKDNFKEAGLLKKEKDRTEAVRHPLLHYVTRFTRNQQKIKNTRDRFANLVKPKPKEDEGDAE
jgi:hypothetical protein